MKRSLLVEDFLRIESIAEPQWSPNKQEILYMLKKVEEGNNKFNTALFVVTADLVSEQLTEFSLNATNARWSPDGKFIAFTAVKEKQSALYLYSVETKEVVDLEFEHSICSYPVWSADGERLAFIATVEGITERDKYYDGAPNFGEKVQDTVSDIKVVTNIRYKYDGKGYLDTSREHVFVTNVPKNLVEKWSNCKRITTGNKNYSFPVWNKKCDSLFVVSETIDDQSVLFEYAVEKINVTNLLKETNALNTGRISELQLSPNGCELSFIAVGSDELYYQHKLYVLNLFNSKTVKVCELEDITLNLSRNIGEMPLSDVRMKSDTPKYKWLKDSSGFTVLYVNSGASVIAEIYRDQSIEKTVLWYDEAKSISAFSRVDNKLALLIGSAESTDSLYIVEEDRCELIVKTNEWLDEEIDLGTVKKFNYLGAEGDEIDGWYITPSNYNQDEKLPTILMIHGGPQGIFGSSFMFRLHFLVSNGFAGVYVNPRGSLSYGIDFALEVINDWGGKDYIDIIKGLEHVIDEGIADKNKLGVMGWSYGGYMTSWIISHTKMFKAAVAGASVINLLSSYGTTDIGYNFTERQLNSNPWDNAFKLLQHSPISYAAKVETPVLLLHGENDLRCPIAQSEEFFTALKRLHKTAVMVRYPNEWHGFRNIDHIKDVIARQYSWFDYYLNQD